MSLVEGLLLFILGFAVSLPASMAGLGGGFIMVPILIVLFGLPPEKPLL